MDLQDLLQALPQYLLLIGVFFIADQIKSIWYSKDNAIPKGGWKCAKCGKIHPSYHSFCSCGAERYEGTAEAKASDEQQIKRDDDAFTEIRKYKELLDDGIITYEEYEAKKQQLLDL